jgi:exonuclease VII large subunit
LRRGRDEPLKVLARGYSIAVGPGGRVIKRAADVERETGWL